METTLFFETLRLLSVLANLAISIVLFLTARRLHVLFRFMNGTWGALMNNLEEFREAKAKHRCSEGTDAIEP